MADWLSNIAKNITNSIDVTSHLTSLYPMITPFSDPPWNAKLAASMLLQLNQVGPPIAYVLETTSNEWDKPIPCNVCQARTRWGQDKQCWGCSHWFHRKCLGGAAEESVGPFHCPGCILKF